MARTLSLTLRDRIMALNDGLGMSALLARADEVIE
jgi:hypothetical protein